MKKLIILLILVSHYGKGQNLVPNPSFELYSICPSGLNQVNRAIGWSSYANTPDYFNTCAPETTLASVPSNWWSYQSPLNGNAYTGFCSYSDGGTDFREVIGCSLSIALTISQKYYVTFNIVNAGLKMGSSSNCCTNKIGMRFTTLPYSFSNPISVTNNAQLYTDSIIKDTLNWQTISGSFIADSNYQYLAISNFFDDLNTDTVKFNGWACTSYYFVDGICVSTDSLYCSNWTNFNEIKIENDFKIFPNPVTTGSITIEFPNGSGSIDILIYDATGRIVLQKSNLIGSSREEINVNNIKPGTYFIRVLNDSHNYSSVLLISN